MKNYFFEVMIGVVVVIIIMAVMFGMRWINQKASPVTVFHPADGITCVQVSSTDGVAISCVK